MALNYRKVWMAIAVIDFEPVVEFYQILLDRPPHPYIHGVYAEFELTGMRLGIFKPKSTHESEFETIEKSAMSLCFAVDDLDEAIGQLNALGYPPVSKVEESSHGREIYARDPAGNRLILYEEIGTPPIEYL
ncbi:VOC family protein [Oxynema sp. CENA135]|uniref:VOC family protein n=1 Tax=Oxynema sp. CENA135 TaxID=984206 RepID=UPI00190CC4DB|nr:VOC family protein [Oxynema sp. CENA135]MBK4731816.1 VOC family protein [Oxynema sp. CENA135]